MKTKYLVFFIVISLALVGSVNLADKVFAQETTGIQNIQYPVKELENCQDESACKSYCDKSENIKACIDFAEKNNLMSQEEIGLARKFIAVENKGPGGCQGKDKCETYCNDISHINECITFAVENNLMPPEELEEAKKVQAAIKRGIKPPPCKNKKQCDVYCEEPEHMEECVTFGAEAGFIQGKELEDAQKMLAALKKGIKPPPCKGKEACDIYCNNPDNMEMCMTFAMEAGFMNEKEKADSQKMLGALKKGVKPPNCRGKDECDAYCQQEEHFEECTNFAEAAGFMTAEEAAMARKTGGKGPGGCKGKEECEAFCNNSDNQETCFNFGKENGLIPEADLKQMEEGKQKFKESLDQAPSAVLECLNSQIGTGLMEKFKSGAAMPPRDIGDKMRTCFEKAMGPVEPGGPGEGGMIPPAGQTGPGGCKNAEECKTYCESHQEECQKFQFQPGPGTVNPGGQALPQQAGFGGCKGPEECEAYCGSHPDECKNTNSGEQFAPGTGPSGSGDNNGEQFTPGIGSSGSPGDQIIQGGPGGMGIEGQSGKNPVVPIGCEGESCPPASMPNQIGELPQPQVNPPLPPENQNPPQIQVAPESPQVSSEQQSLISNPQSSTENIAPLSTVEAPVPPPSSIKTSKPLLGSFLNLFLSIFKR